MTSDLPPIVKAAERLLAEIERAVRGFVRVDRNSVGTTLRQQAMDLCRICNRAWRDHARQLDWTNRLVWAIDEIKTSLRLGKDVHAFRAPDFGDRVVHHWLVPQLEAIWEPRFIHDSYANRSGKGSHAAVRRLQDFAREVQSGEGGGWYLQLDIRNFFNSIHRPTLYALLKPTMERHGLPIAIQRATHALLRRAPLAAGVHTRGTAAERAQVPPHKRLANAAPGCGLPIGNLSSQFFANVYLDQLDQFVKHTLKAKRYLRYVDDFILVHRDRAQLEAWLARIRQFLADRLRLALKDDVRLRSLSDGIDFLGYIVRPTHTLVRPRVVAHAREAFARFERAHVYGGRICAIPADLRHVQAQAASYAGHLRHASSWRLTQSLHRAFPWLAAAVKPRRFHHALERRHISIQFGRRG